MQSRGGFGRNIDEPPFYVRYDSSEVKDAAGRTFGPRFLNCADDTHFARDCPAAYSNRSCIMNPAVREGTLAEVMTRAQVAAKTALPTTCSYLLLYVQSSENHVQVHRSSVKRL